MTRTSTVEAAVALGGNIIFPPALSRARGIIRGHFPADTHKPSLLSSFSQTEIPHFQPEREDSCRQTVPECVNWAKRGDAGGREEEEEGKSVLRTCLNSMCGCVGMCSGSQLWGQQSKQNPRRTWKKDVKQGPCANRCKYVLMAC